MAYYKYTAEAKQRSKMKNLSLHQITVSLDKIREITYGML